MRPEDIENEELNSQNISTEEDAPNAISNDENMDSSEKISSTTSTQKRAKYKIPPLNTEETKHFLSGMFQTWFLDYASYVNLDRAVPHINDGLKPVQRRILHSMKRLEDGRYNKVANIVGHTMQFHPHGDSSIAGALVTMGQKDLLIDCQGNWGHILTGDDAAASRYIEARLSNFAKEILYSPKVTEWKPSYDGRNQEPITLPVKFPLLLAQGTEGIGVGLNSKILPHNFNELLDAAIAYLKEKEFELYPDFITGGQIDISKYNDGKRGGQIRIRAKINKLDQKTLVISEIPFGTTTPSLSTSITKALESGKIKIKKVEDNTSKNAEILVHLLPGTSSDKTIDALYAFTNCEISISPNCCVIDNNKPMFVGVSDLLRKSVDNTKEIFRRELEIQRDELLEKLFIVSLEKIFMTERIYKDKEFENAKSQEEAIKHIDKRLTPYKKDFIREITTEDLQRLFEIKMGRILKYRAEEADDLMIGLKDSIKEVEYHLAHLIDYTITWYKGLKARYGKKYPRKTEIRNFENIEAAKVVEANEKLYIDRENGFIGTGLKKYEYICNCSDIDDIIIFFKNGKYKIVKVADKLHVGKDIIHIAVFKKNDKRTVYNAVYRDGKDGFYYIKRFSVFGITRDKEYDLTQETANSKVIYFSANPNGEAEIIKITHKPKARLKTLVFEKDFSEISIKGRGAQGNILTKMDIHRITLKAKGGSTLGGRNVWFDHDVHRLNYDGRGILLGEFHADDLILVINKKGEYYTTSFEVTNHYDPDILRIEKFDPNKIWSLALTDADQQGFKYIKRFSLDPTTKKISLIGENEASKLLILTDTVFPRFKATFGGNDTHRESLEIDVEQFIGVKSVKAKGKRISTFEIKKIEEIEPTRFPENEEETKEKNPEIEIVDTDNRSDAEIMDELTGQGNLFQ